MSRYLFLFLCIFVMFSCSLYSQYSIDNYAANPIPLPAHIGLSFSPGISKYKIDYEGIDSHSMLSYSVGIIGCYDIAKTMRISSAIEIAKNGTRTNYSDYYVTKSKNSNKYTTYSVYFLRIPLSFEGKIPATDLPFIPTIIVGCNANFPMQGEYQEKNGESGEFTSEMRNLVWGLHFGAGIIYKKTQVYLKYYYLENIIEEGFPHMQPNEFQLQLGYYFF